MNLRELIQEQIRHLNFNQFYIDNNINPENLSYLGKGDFGEAYSTGDGRVLKLTSSKSEFNLANEIINNDAQVLRNGFAIIYKTEIVDNNMLILMEELDEDSHIEDLYYELQNYLEEQNLPIRYINYLETNELEFSDELISFIDDVDDIIRAYRYLGVEASDIKPDNMGRDKNNKIKAFDIDDKRK
jgi:hypothetical protein